MDTPGIDFDLDAVPTGGISGTLTDSVTGFPLLGVEVEVFNPGGGFEGSGFTDSAGDYTVSGLPIGTVFARTDNFQGYLDELYDDLPCFSGCTPTSGTAIAVMTGVTTPGIDFALDPGGTISGVVIDTGTGLPISGIEVEIWDSGEFFAGSDFTDGAGVYAVSGLKAETHFATTINFQGYNDELYDDVACPGGAFAGCAPAAGTPIAVMAATTTAGINFDLVLQPTGSISGTITDGDTGLPLSGIEVEVFNSSGFFVDNDFTDGSGFYAVSGLPPGAIFARTDNFQSYLDELYNNLACFSGCSVTSGTPIGVTAGMTTTGIDFSLGLSGSITGMVTDAVTGLPLGGIEVEVFNSVGVFVANGFTNGAGLYSVNGLPTGTYFARSDNFQGYMDKLFDDLPCSPGCVPTTGTPIFVSSGFTGIGGTGDCNGDGIVDAADLVAVLLNLGGTDPACDVNEDGVVDNDDLVALTELIFTQ